jgi:hypothetical protein
VKKSLKKPYLKWIILGDALLIGILVYLGMTNPTLSDYQAQILTPAAEARRHTSDSLVASIVRSVPIPGHPAQKDPNDQSGIISLLTNRTTMSNFLFFSFYDTQYDFCPNDKVNRQIKRTLGIADQFVDLGTSGCPAQTHASAFPRSSSIALTR